MGELRIHGIAAPSYGLWTGWSAPDNRCLLQFHHTVCWQYHCRFGGHTRFRVIVTSCGRALGRYAIARNPLVISPLLGILFSMAALPLPKAASNYLDLMGAAVAPWGFRSSANGKLLMQILYKSFRSEK